MDPILSELQLVKELIIKTSVFGKEILTTNELSIYLDLSKSCIYKLISNGDLPCYSPGGKKKYFKKSEIDTWVLQNRICSSNDLEKEMDSYLLTGLKYQNE